MSTALQRDLASLGFTVPRLAGVANLSRSSMIRRLRDGNFFWREFDNIMGQAVQMNPLLGWRYAPDWIGLPPYPEDADWHPAATMLDARNSARDFVDELDDAASPSSWTPERRVVVRQKAWRLLGDVLRFLLSLEVKH